jgi:hypothetical protein
MHGLGFRVLSYGTARVTRVKTPRQLRLFETDTQYASTLETHQILLAHDCHSFPRSFSEAQHGHLPEDPSATHRYLRMNRALVVNFNFR